MKNEHAKSDTTGLAEREGLVARGMIAARRLASRAAPLIVNLAALVLTAFLFAASFPNTVFERGLPFLAWIAFAPVFWLLRRVSLGSSIAWGALYGYLAYAIFNYWLGGFHPLAGFIVYAIYLFYMALLFPLLKAAALFFPRRGYLVQWLLWLAYEYLRTRGFLGYSYGISGYSQWELLPLIQIASIFGVWGVSALVVFPSALLGSALPDGFWRSLRDTKSTFFAFFKRERLALGLWLLALAGSLLYGFISPIDYSQAPSLRVALIQHNTDPWVGGLPAYRDNFNSLSRLSLEALAQEPKPELVVWSETAFVPRIHWHLTYKEDISYFELVSKLMRFLEAQDVPFVIGNHDARLELDEQGRPVQRDYNAVLLFERGVNTGIYRKLHLVPFTEHFPYGKQLPLVYAALEASDTHFWDRGGELTLLEANGLRFGTPICFEDSFGYLSRDWVREGAQLIVNLTNDAWAKSLPAQMQHMNMAVFRAVENRRSLVRATASGQTCAIDPNGRVLAMAEPFIETQLSVDVPLVDEASLYTAYGDFLAIFFVAAAALALALGAALALARKMRRPQA